LKLTRPDWYLIITGVFFYGAIGACYPIIGALVAQINEVSSAVLCLSMCAIFNRFVLLQIFSESNKDTILELSQQVSIGLIALAFAAGFFYFASVIKDFSAFLIGSVHI